MINNLPLWIKGFSLKFHVDSQVQQETPEEDQRRHQLKGVVKLVTVVKGDLKAPFQ